MNCKNCFNTVEFLMTKVNSDKTLSDLFYCNRCNSFFDENLKGIYNQLGLPLLEQQIYGTKKCKTFKGHDIKSISFEYSYYKYDITLGDYQNYPIAITTLDGWQYTRKLKNL